MQDAEYMTLGMWVDYIVEWNSLQKASSPEVDTKTGEQVQVTRATQKDFDTF